MERNLHISIGMIGRALLVASLLSGACGPDDGAPDDGFVTEETAHALSSSFDLSLITERFAVAEELATLPLPMARLRAIADARDSISAIIMNAECLTVDTDDTTYLELTFDECRVGILGLFQLDGALRAELAFETTPCGPADCPTAALYTLSTSYLRVSGALGQRFVDVSGEWQLRDPIALGEPFGWESGVILTDDRARSIQISSTAEWSIEDNCVHAELDTRATLTGREDLGTIAARAEGIVRCPARCPQQGTVSVSYGAGEILMWTYTGDDSVLATGPRGREVEVPIPCTAL